MTDLQLHRADLHKVASTTRKCLAVLPPGNNKKQQKIVIGDDEGIVTSFGVKKGDAQVVFKTLTIGKEVTRLELGGPPDGFRDKIFVAAGQRIVGITKKGKEFFKFNTNMSEPINSMFVDEVNIWTGGEYIFQQFTDCKDTNFFMAEDRINDLVADRFNGPDGDAHTILACHDRSLRVLQGSNLCYQIDAEGPVTTLHRAIDPAKQIPHGYRELFYGTQNGSVSQVLLNGLQNVREGTWSLPNPRHLGGVQCVSSYDFTKDGVKDVLVGRDDGSIEVYGFNEIQQPVNVFSANINESVTTVDAGSVSVANFDDLVVSTYSGQVTCFSNAPQVIKEADIGHKINKLNEKKIYHLRRDIEELKVQIMKEKEAMLELTSNEQSTAIHVVQKESFKVNDRFSLNASDATYTLSIEVTNPLDCIALHCDAEIDLLNTEGDSDVITSFTKPKTDADPRLMVTLRCQNNANRVDVKVRTIEGQQGTLTAFVIPRVQPKSCQVRTYPVRPLSLHTRVTSLADEGRPLNELRLSGPFSVAEMHMWLGVCLPDVPSRATSDDMRLEFRSSMVDTVLSCSYKKGSAVFRSDNISAISILKDTVTREATNRKISLNISFDIKQQSVVHVLELLKPLLEFQLSLQKKKHLIEGLREVKIAETDVKFLSPEYSAIIADADKIEQLYKLQPKKLEHLHSIVVNIYSDYCKFKGSSVSKTKLGYLQNQLNNYDHAGLVALVNEID